MQGQLEQMTKQLPELQTAANAARDSVIVARNTLDSNNQSAANTLTEIQKQSKAMQDAATAASNQVAGIKESNQLNRDSLISVQRAVVSFQAINANLTTERRPTEDIESIRFVASMTNAGNTTANVEFECFAGGNVPSEPTEEQFRECLSTSTFSSECKTVMSAGKAVGPKAPFTLGDYAVPWSFFGINPRASQEKIQTRVVGEGETLFIWGWVCFAVFAAVNELLLAKMNNEVSHSDSR